MLLDKEDKRLNKDKKTAERKLNFKNDNDDKEK